MTATTMTTTTRTTKLTAAVALLLCVSRTSAQNLDQFNYDETDLLVTNNYGPQDWKNVRCADPDTCVRCHAYHCTALVQFYQTLWNIFIRRHCISRSLLSFLFILSVGLARRLESRYRMGLARKLV
jgi:hypothetical protein